MAESEEVRYVIRPKNPDDYHTLYDVFRNGVRVKEAIHYVEVKPFLIEQIEEDGF